MMAEWGRSESMKQHYDPVKLGIFSFDTLFRARLPLFLTSLKPMKLKATRSTTS